MLETILTFRGCLPLAVAVGRDIRFFPILLLIRMDIADTKNMGGFAQAEIAAKQAMR